MADNTASKETQNTEPQECFIKTEVTGTADSTAERQAEEDIDIQCDIRSDNSGGIPSHSADGGAIPAMDLYSAGIKTEKLGDNNDGVIPGHSGEGETSSAIDPYSYLKRDEFTTEIYKIEMMNLPKKFGLGQLKKRLTSINLKPGKIKAFGGHFAFVNFRCEEDRAEALTAINGHIWKGRTLKAKKANPAADPMLKKRKLEAEADNTCSEKKARVEPLSEKELTEKLLKAVAPLYTITYEEQLKMKQEKMEEFMKKLCLEGERNNYKLKKWFAEQKKQYDGFCCELLPIRKSPLINGYRNKCEFTIGKSPQGKDKTVGFRVGSYREGAVWVVEPDQCDHLLSTTTKQVAKAVQKCIGESPWPSFNPVDHHGNWSMLTVRETSGGVMAIVEFHVHVMSQEEVDSEKSRLKDYFISGSGKDCGISSLYFVPKREREVGLSYEHLFGEKFLEEELLGMKFRISPDAFFQVNTPAAEVLYSTIADWCNITPQTLLIDLCCGTGTIGLTMAKRVRKVIGIEMVKQAVEDAKVNARLNGIENVEYYCDKAENVFPDLRYRFGGDVMAVVDPPRSGLHSKVLQTIRKCSNIQRLVYVSCNPNGALANMVDLMRSESKRIRGEAFVPVRAVTVDLFPHTNHCELVILFERIQQSNNETKDNLSTTQDNLVTGGNNLVTSGDNPISGEDDPVITTDKPVRVEDNLETTADNPSTNPVTL